MHHERNEQADTRAGGRRASPGFKLTAAVLSAALLLAGCNGSDEQTTPATGSAQQAQGQLGIKVLSSKPEYVTGDSALIEIAMVDASATLAAGAPKVLLNGVDVSSALQADSAHAGHYVGVVSGIVQGNNTLVATAGNAAGTLTLTAYPISGPVISGPHQTPFICQTAAFVMPDGSTLGAATDANCMVAPRVDYLYLPLGGTNLVPWTDISHLPADVASATTLGGTTMPFVVRLETRVIDRGIYQSVVLHDPTAEAAPTPMSPPKGWNRRLMAIQGVGCPPGWYIQGAVQGSTSASGFDLRLLNPQRLAEGYALFANTLLHGANNCNPLLASEAAMMSKEQFVKTHGVPDFTVASGNSGGSYGSLQTADRIPGLYDGVLVLSVFPDGLASSLAGSDSRLLSHYWAVTNPTDFSAAQRAAVTGYEGDDAMVATTLNSNRTDPVPGRIDIAGYSSAGWSTAVPLGLRYDPVANPSGARPTVYDTAKNAFGVNRSSGFALKPYDNVGVQYGLAAMNAGTITAKQFLDLNESIGGYDADANYTSARAQGDPGAITRAYQSGLLLDGGAGLSAIPVLDLTGQFGESNNYHQQWQHFALRERLAKANGDLGNYLMWRSPTAVPADTAWNLFIQWVAAYKSDSADGTQRARVLRNRPAAAVEGCWNGTTFIPESLTLSSTANTACNALLPSWSFPRRVAGGPLAANILKCALKPPQRADYSVTFTDAEWLRLQTVFASGVCDWSKPGIGQTGVVVNGSFGPSPVNKVFSVLD